MRCSAGLDDYSFVINTAVKHPIATLVEAFTASLSDWKLCRATTVHGQGGRYTLAQPPCAAPDITQHITAKNYSEVVILALAGAMVRRK